MHEQLRGLIQDPAAEPAAAAGYTLIDVRQPEEWAHGTIPSAKLIPLGQVHEALEMDGEDFEDEYGWAKPAGDSLVVFYCKSGVRSSNAQAIATHVGYTQTLNYRGSWMEWADRAYDDEDGGGPP